jgi:agmatine deiminase
MCPDGVVNYLQLAVAKRNYTCSTAIVEGIVLYPDFTFDGWGGKFEASLDNAVNRALHKKGYMGTTPLESIDFILEGGSIESDGAGTIMTSSRCLCNPNRNGNLGKKEIEEKLEKYLGARRILWLEHGYLAGDDTDGHVDMLARFASADTIVYLKCSDKNDEHYDELNKMEDQLHSFRRADGKPYRLMPLPMCEARFNEKGERLPASYANFLIANRALLYPVYGDENDKTAGELFKKLFTGREIIPIPCSELIKQGGSLHCSTMQINY